MGVQGLWQLLNPTGRPVSLQSLEGKILAVDVSIWLHQAVKGMRDRDGNPLPNAHLQVLFNRLCKLLYYRIKPVFVFDGGVPALKRQTMAGRRERKEFAELESDKATKNLVQNLLKSHAINEVLKKDDKKSTNLSGVQPSSKPGKADLFELPPLPEEFKSIAEESRRTEFTAHERMLLQDIDLDQIDIESDVFNSLPAEMKHEVLTMIKERKKRHTWNQILELPQESNDFSKFQMAKLIKQNKLSAQLVQVEQEMKDKRSGELTKFLGDDFYSDVIETRKIMSDDSAHSILIKGLGSKEQKEELERIRLELEAKKVQEKVQLPDVYKKEGDVINEIMDMDFSGIEVENKQTSNQVNTKIMHMTQDNNVISNEKFGKNVASERQEILQELQQRMNVLKEDSLSNDVCENDLSKNNPVEISNKIPKDDNDLITEIPICGLGDDSNGKNEQINSHNVKQQDIVSDEVNMSYSVLENEKQLPKNSTADLVSTRQSILDELRKKVNVLTAHVELDNDMEGLHKNEEKSNDNSVEIKPSESRKTLMRKQLSLEEEEVSKKRKIEENSISKNYTEEPKIVIASNSESDSEDEGFIEVTIDPENIQADELFPANIFKPVSKDVDIFKDSLSNQNPENDLSSDTQKDVSNEILKKADEEQEIILLQDSELHNSDEDMPQGSPEKEDYPHSDLVEQFRHFTENDMRNYQESLEVESRDLQQERGRQERLAVSITDQMYLEAQELLELFGVPYVVSPMEAEAQCAQLDASDLTHGTITDDSDIWLFGGKRVYKNFFYQDKHVEFFSDLSITSQLGLGRDVFIKLALLCGSDYTEGIQGVGVITAMELLTEFPGDHLNGLKAFKKWWDAAQTQISVPLEAKIRTKFRNLQVPEGFPNEVVVEAYMHPEVDDSNEKFSWGQPELDLIRLFTKQKFGWSQEKCDESLLPMMKQLNLKQTQTRINSFFQPENFLEPKNIKSKRLQRALNIMKGKGDAMADQYGRSDNILKQSTSSPSLSEIQNLNTVKRQSNVGKGRGRGKGKGKGKGKSSVGQRSRVIIKDTINLSESSSESSGDELIASLDYESIMEENSTELSHTLSIQGTSNTIESRTKKLQTKEKKNKKLALLSEGNQQRSKGQTKTSVEKESSSLTINGSSETNTVSEAGTNVPVTNSASQTGSVKVRRTQPNIRIGKGGHATEEFSLDLPKEPVKRFLEDEVQAFDKVKKARSKVKTAQSAMVKEQKIDKGKRLSKNSQTEQLKKSKKKTSEDTNIVGQPISSKDSNKKSQEDRDSDGTLKSDNVVVGGSLLSRIAQNRKTGTVNRVMVMSDSDSD